MIKVFNERGELQTRTDRIYEGYKVKLAFACENQTSITWTKDSNPYPQGDDKQEITFESVVQSDSGTYIANAVNPNATIPTNPVTLTVLPKIDNNAVITLDESAIPVSLQPVQAHYNIALDYPDPDAVVTITLKGGGTQTGDINGGVVALDTSGLSDGDTYPLGFKIEYSDPFTPDQTINLTLPVFAKTILDRQVIMAGIGDSYMDYSDGGQTGGQHGRGTNYESAYTLRGVISGTSNALPLGWHGINCGIGGETTAQILTRVPAILALNPDLVVLNGGINDIAANVPTDQIVANMKSIIDLCVAAGKKVVFLPINYFKTSGDVDAINAAYDEMLKPYAGKVFKVAFKNFVNDMSMLYSDELHPSALGGTMLGRDIANVVNLVMETTWKPSANIGSKINVGETYPDDNMGLTPRDWFWWSDAWDGNSSMGCSEDGDAFKISTGGNSKDINLGMDAIENTGSESIFVQMAADIEFYGYSGDDSEDDPSPTWKKSDKFTMIIGNEAMSAVGSSVGQSMLGDDVPKVTFKTGLFEIPAGQKFSQQITLHSGTNGNPDSYIRIKNAYTIGDAMVFNKPAARLLSEQAKRLDGGKKKTTRRKASTAKKAK